jgi:hypothetical protein
VHDDTLGDDVHGRAAMKLDAKRILVVLFAALALAYVIVHVAAVFTEAVNWDELALFKRAEFAAKLGRIDGGGRPGLGVLVLVPFVSGCDDTMSTITAVRLVWAAITLSGLAAVFLVIRRLARSWTAAAFGVAALALVPYFMRWSIQVRTDQPAIAAVLWGTVALLASRERTKLAIAGGALWAIGYLFTQKAVYLAGLGGVLVLGELFRDNTFDRRRELVRTGWFIVAAGAVYAAYKFVTPLFFETAKAADIGRSLNTFAYYRKLFGFRVYEAMVPTIRPQLAALALLVPAAIVAYRRKSEHWRVLLIALAVAAAGLVVGRFHAAAFPYFWMTLGLFLACAIGLGWPGIAEMLSRARIPFAVAGWLWLLWISTPYARELLTDTRAPQRDAFAFVESNFPASAQGFMADGGLFCREDPKPFRGYLRETVDIVFTGPDGERNADAFIADFRQRPVSFIVETFLLQPFPPKIQAFWGQHYVSYRSAVAIPGRRFRGPANAMFDVDIIVPGDYRWFGPGVATIDGARIEPSTVVALSVGHHPLVLQQDTANALLAFAVAEPPGPKPDPFHAIMQIAEIVGLRQRWP